MNNSFLDNFIETISIFTAIAGIILAIQISYGYFILSVLSLIFLVLWKRSRKKKLALLSRENLLGQWAREHIENRDFLHIKEFHNLEKENNHGDFLIDDITWRDLNMDSIFSKLDHTKSYPGMQVLYDLLRKPIFNKEILEERKDIIESLRAKKDLALKIQEPLSILGKKQSKDIFAYFKSGLDIKTNPLLAYRILSYLSYFSIILLFINRQLGFIALATILSINAWIYQRNKYKIEAEIEIFRYIANLVKCAEKLKKIDSQGIDLKQDRMQILLKETRQIYKNVSALNTNASPNNEFQIILDYINMLTLREAIIFYKTINLMNDYRDQLLEIYSLIGQVDSYLALASYKDGLTYSSQPQYIRTEGEFYLKAEALYHPLIEKPVPYDFEFANKGALVTGSNASGKSTFLRTIGINSLLGQTFYFVLAKNYKSNFFKLLTSIGTTDSIEEGDSYFMAEAKSLKRIIDSLDKEEAVLCILDEIFRGTNTAERISAASEVLTYMSNENSCVVAATHDLELTSMIDEKYNNYHFKETIEENDIIFDYILNNGPTTSRNALAILRYLDYPKEIYENANKRVEDYIDFTNS